MTRYDQYKPLDDQPKPMGDRTFLGVNMRLDPALVPSGMVSEAINVRFRNGVAETRLGYAVLPWLNKVTVTSYGADHPVTQTGGVATFTIDGSVALKVGSVVMITGADQTEYNGAHIVTSVTPGTNTFTYEVSGSPASPATGAITLVDTSLKPWGVVHGVGVFSDPFTLQEYLIIAADGGVYYTQPNNVPQAMTLPAGVVLTGQVEFTQAFDVLLMHRGPDADTLMLPRITLPWQLVEQSASGDGTETIPNATHSLYLQNRLFVPNDNDEIAVSDLNDYTRYVPILQEFKINQGSADRLVAVTKFNDTTIIALKERSVYAISNVYGNLEAMQQDELTGQFGCVARKSVAHVGNDLWFLSEFGVMSITQTQQNKLQGVVLPASDPIQPLIDRINWRYASEAVAAYADNKYYLSVPLDDAEMLGIELAPQGWQTVADFYFIAVTAGRTYRWQPGNTTSSLDNGGQTFTGGTEFVAQGSSVWIHFPVPGHTVDDSLREVIAKGVNNATLVYDFLDGAWSGHDESPGLAVQSLFKLKYEGHQRLFTGSLSGWLMLNEENYEDQLPVPYTELTVTAVPPVGDKFQVNSGTVVTTAMFQGAAELGVNWPQVETVANNLWADAFINAGYYPFGGVGVWTAPNTKSVKATNGVRFYSSNGVLPVVTLNAASETPWAVLEVNEQPVEARLVTRGYASDALALSTYNWVNVDVQTWAPETSIVESTTGVNEEQEIITDQTRDRTLYYQPSDATPYDLDNDNGDFLTPYRQDYSLLLGSPGTGATVDFALHTTPDGVPLDRHQEVRITERTTAYGRAALVEVENTAGRVRVMSVSVEADEQPFSAGTKA